MMIWKSGLIAVAIMIAGPAIAGRTAVEEKNARTVAAFLDTVFNKHEVAEGFRLYVGPEYIQHNPNVPSGSEAGTKGLTALVTRFPSMKIEIKRVLADGDLVSVHLHEVREPGTRGTAIAEYFRLSKGRIVEHWDVIQEVVEPEKTRNANGMF